MKWNEMAPVKLGTLRIVKKFLWFPMRIGYERIGYEGRWLETAYVEQEYIGSGYADPHLRWINKRWATKEEFLKGAK